MPHVGSALPVLADRVQGLTTALASDEEPVDVHSQLRRMWFDVAGESLPNALPALLRLVGPERLLYGSDMPFTPASAIERIARALRTTSLLDAKHRRAMLGGNALAMLSGQEPARRSPASYTTSNSKETA